MTLYLTSPGGGVTEGWIDVTIPAGYVTGSNFTVNLDMVATSGVQPCYVYAVPVTFNGGTWTACPTGVDGITSIGSGFMATLKPGVVAVTYLPAANTNQLVPTTRGIVPVTCVGVNRNTEGWNSFYGSGLWPTWLVGGLTVTDAVNSPFYPTYMGPAGSGAGEDPPGWEALGFNQITNEMFGGTGFSAAPAPGTIFLSAGQTISIVIYTEMPASIRHNLYGITVDFGPGGIVTVPITNMMVSNFNLGTASGDHNGSPTLVSAVGAPFSSFDFNVWVTAGTVPPTGNFSSQGQIF